MRGSGYKSAQKMTGLLWCSPRSLNFQKYKKKSLTVNGNKFSGKQFVANIRLFLHFFPDQVVFDEARNYSVYSQ